MPRPNRGPYLVFVAKRGVYYIHWPRGDGSQGTKSTGAANAREAENAFRRFMEDEWASKAVKVRGTPAQGFIYFIGGDMGAIKIGYTTDLGKRLATLQCGSPIPLSILASTKGTKDDEWTYHNMLFHRHRLHGEWFDRHVDVLAEIQRINALNSDSSSHLRHFTACSAEKAS